MYEHTNLYAYASVSVCVFACACLLYMNHIYMHVYVFVHISMYNAYSICVCLIIPMFVRLCVHVLCVCTYVSTCIETTRNWSKVLFFGASCKGITSSKLRAK